jgi:hypothetical protein
MLHLALWGYGQDLRAQWSNVPPAPNAHTASLTALGDDQLAYRFYGLMIQHLGNTGGHFRPLKNYNYKRLEPWFETMDHLDPKSNFMPVLAAYYFGGTQNPDQLDYVIPYLQKVGQRSSGEKWRWLAHAVYLARYRQNNLDLALRMAKELSNNYRDDMPEWVKRMPASIHVAKGDKQAAIDFMLSILKSRGNKLAPGEVQVMRHYLCEHILDTQKARTEAICKEIYENNGD